MSIYQKMITVTSPAKINLHLAVKDKRQDGFHNLESIFLAVNFGDTLHFELSEDEDTVELSMESSPELSVKGLSFNFSGIQTEENIIYRAVSLFKNKSGFKPGVRVRVEKCIPLGSGLGGGSSNAASTLLALNNLTGSPFDRDDLLDMGATLGSDVPFFIHETVSAWVTGRGECIKPINAPYCFIVLVNPGFPSDTAKAFRLFEKKVTDTSICLRNLTTEYPEFHSEKELCKVTGTFFNDFLDVFEEPEKSVYNKIIFKLSELGAVFAGLSGAGSTCFGVFTEKEPAEKAAAEMRKEWVFAECTFPKGMPLTCDIYSIFYGLSGKELANSLPDKDLQSEFPDNL